MSVIKLPEVLCVHLKRFRFDAYFSTKISRHISFPLTDLDMSDYLRGKRAHKERYSLDAVITHIGGAGDKCVCVGGGGVRTYKQLCAPH